MLTLPNCFILAFPFFCFVEQLVLARHVAAVQFRGHVFAEWLDRGAGDNVAADGTLDRNLELVAGNRFGQLFAVMQGPGSRFFAMDQVRQRIDRFFVHQNVYFDNVGFAVLDRLVVERTIAARDHLQLAVENRTGLRPAASRSSLPRVPAER